MKIIRIIICLLMITIGHGWERAVCEKNGLQLFPMIVTDGEDGAIVAWIDNWHSLNQKGNYEVYAKRIKGGDGSTAPGWNVNGNIVSLPPGNPHGHRLHNVVAPGNVGEIIACWVNHHSLESHLAGIYCQKMKNGAPQWPDPNRPNQGGIEIYSSSDPYKRPICPPSMCSDGAGGCVIAWRVLVYDGNRYYESIKVAKLTSDGKLDDDKWFTNPISVAETTGNHPFFSNPKVVKAGNYAVVLWEKIDNLYVSAGTNEHTEFYARKVSLLNGTLGSRITIDKKSNEEYYYWHVLDFDVKARDNGNVYVAARWTNHRKRKGLYVYHHGRCLMITLYKLNINDSRVEGSRMISGFNVDSNGKIGNTTLLMAIEQMPIRPPVLALRNEGGVVAHPKGSDTPNSASDTTKNWWIQVHYFNEKLQFSSYSYGSSTSSAHLPDIIGVGNESILVYSQHEGNDFSGKKNAKIVVMRLDNKGKHKWIWHSSGIKPMSSPKVIRSDNFRCIVVWGEKNKSTSWDIKAVRLNTETGKPE